MATQGPVLRAYSSLHTGVLWTAATKSGQGHRKLLSQIIDISYHMCKFRIIVVLFDPKF
jgi:hypothetical protein